MKRRNDTEIEFSGLKPGVYTYDFELESDFFEPFDNDKLCSATVHFQVKMEKTERVMMLHFTFSGMLDTVCDRCLGPLTVTIGGEETINVKFSDSETSQSYDEIVLPTNAYKVDLAQQFYDMVAVTVPLQCLHPDGDDGQPSCDPEMLKYINIKEDEEGVIETATSSPQEAEEEIDPRWLALKSLKDN